MTSKEAWNSMIQGKKVRLKTWPKNNYIYFYFYFDKDEYKIKKQLRY